MIRSPYGRYNIVGAIRKLPSPSYTHTGIARGGTDILRQDRIR